MSRGAAPPWKWAVRALSAGLLPSIAPPTRASAPRRMNSPTVDPGGRSGSSDRDKGSDADDRFRTVQPCRSPLAENRWRGATAGGTHGMYADTFFGGVSIARVSGSQNGFPD